MIVKKRHYFGFGTIKSIQNTSVPYRYPPIKNSPAGTYTMVIPSLGEIIVEPMPSVGVGAKVSMGVLVGQAVGAIFATCPTAGVGVSIVTGGGRLKKSRKAPTARATAPAKPRTAGLSVLVFRWGLAAAST